MSPRTTGSAMRLVPRVRSALLAALLLAGCPASHAEDPCASPSPPPPPPERERCAPLADDEGASPPDAATVLLPVRLRLWQGGRAADAIVLAGRPGDPSMQPRRLTFRAGLSDGSLTLLGSEPLGQAWFDARVAEARSAGLARQLACLELPGGGELRLLPSLPEPVGPAPEGEFYGPVFGAALRQLDPAGVETARFPLWAPDTGSELRRCGDWLVHFEPSGEQRLRCTPFREGPCPGACLTNTDSERRWQCTGQAPDGLLYCEPPPAP